MFSPSGAQLESRTCKRHEVSPIVKRLIHIYSASAIKPLSKVQVCISFYICHEDYNT